MSIRPEILDEAMHAYERDAAADEAVFMARWRKVAPRTAVKHLQGQHDQAKHGGGGDGETVPKMASKGALERAKHLRDKPE